MCSFPTEYRQYKSSLSRFQCGHFACTSCAVQCMERNRECPHCRLTGTALLTPYIVKNMRAIIEPLFEQDDVGWVLK